MKYEIWSNTSDRATKFITGYQPTDAIMKTWTGVVLPPHGPSPLDYLFSRFNEDSRPNRNIAHSLSVGDVIVLNSRAFTVDVIGFTELKEFQPNTEEKEESAKP
jgi:hypothetical protein